MKNKISIRDKIFIAGANGMVGKAIKQKLLEKGYGNKILGGKLLTPARSELDLLNQKQVNNWFAEHKPDVVILAAAKVGGILANNSFPVDFLLENIKLQINVIESSWLHNVKRLLFLGSSCIYPKFCKQPIMEESLMDGLLEPTNESYAIAKISGIKLCEALRIQYGFDAICLMPTNLYGPGDNYHSTQSHVLPSLIRKFSEAAKTEANSVRCWGSGKPLREFLHVEDLAEAAIFSLESWHPSSEDAPKKANGENLIYLNVGTGQDISIKDLAKKIAFETGFKGEIIWDKSKPDGTPKKQLNIEKIKMLGWEPKINFEEGIKDTIKNYKKECKDNKIRT